MMSTTRHLRTIVLTVACMLAARAAQAQSVDYGGLERVFGEPVTASVTGKPQRATDAPANVEIITQDDIRRSGATSIPDVLEFVTASMCAATAWRAPMSASAATTRPPTPI
jgi:outer membrane receptor for ferrienterochelin and colicins